jgi:hypothetical protein
MSYSKITHWNGVARFRGLPPAGRCLGLKGDGVGPLAHLSSGMGLLQPARLGFRGWTWTRLGTADVFANCLATRAHGRR